MELQDVAHLASHLILVVRLAEEGERRPVRPRRRLDHVRDVLVGIARLRLPVAFLTYSLNEVRPSPALSRSQRSSSK